MSKINNTEFLYVEFFTKGQEPVPYDATNIKLIIYDKMKQVIDEFDVGLQHKISTGKYEYAYIIPNLTNKFGDFYDIFFEFSGYVKGVYSSNRGRIQCKW